MRANYHDKSKSHARETSRVTISILARDAETGALGGAAATGSLCVGGWVLRGNPLSGLSASQGTAPSTLWGEAVLIAMRDGTPAADAVDAAIAPDPGRAHRQLAALDPAGGTGAFTGTESVAHAGAMQAPGLVVAGNMLTGPAVIDAAAQGYHDAAALPFAERLLAALVAAAGAGGDARGLKSAALLVVARDRAPLTLRIDHSENPLAALADLYRVSQTEPYRGWTELVPVLSDPHRAPAPDQVPETPEPIIEEAPRVRR
jgi:uncharacterized Ntn-hydrolase superfamily protein